MSVRPQLQVYPRACCMAKRAGLPLCRQACLHGPLSLPFCPCMLIKDCKAIYLIVSGKHELGANVCCKSLLYSASSAPVSWQPGKTFRTFGSSIYRQLLPESCIYKHLLLHGMMAGRWLSEHLPKPLKNLCHEMLKLLNIVVSQPAVQG